MFTAMREPLPVSHVIRIMVLVVVLLTKQRQKNCFPLHQHLIQTQQMHDEVSETENIRQNLAIERMIIGGCDILLDVNQGKCFLFSLETLLYLGQLFFFR